MRLTLIALGKPILRFGYARKMKKTMSEMSLKPVTELFFQLDPFSGNVKSLREAMFNLTAEKVLATSARIDVKTKVVDDRSEPFMMAKFEDGQNYLFKTGNLTGVEILMELDRLIQIREPRSRVKPQHMKPRPRGK